MQAYLTESNDTFNRTPVHKTELLRDFYGKQESKKRQKPWKNNWAEGKKKIIETMLVKNCEIYLLENSV